MTDLDSRLRSSMSQTPTRTTTSSDGWDSVTERAAHRRRRRDRFNRVTFAAALGLLSIGLFRIVDQGLGPNSGAIDAASGEAGDGGGQGGSLGLIAIGVVIVLALATRWMRRSQPSLLSAVDNPTRAVALAVALGAIAAPLVAYVEYRDEIGTMERGYKSVEGLEIIERSQNTNPFVGGADPVIILTVRPSEASATNRAERVDQALEAFGFTDRIGTLVRNTGDWPNHAAEVTDNADGTFTIGIAETPALARQWMPLVTAVASYVLAMTSLAFLSTRLGRTLGAITLFTAAGQLLLVGRALSRSAALLDRYAAEQGRPFDFELLVQSQTEASADLYRSINGVAVDLYPFGSFSTLLFAIPWIIGVRATFGRRWRASVAYAIGVVAILGVAIFFAPISSDVVNITD